MRATVTAAPYSVSKLLGKLVVRRHFTFSLVCWAKAGLAARAATAAAGTNCRRLSGRSMVMGFLLLLPASLGRHRWYRYQFHAALQPPSIGMAEPVMSAPAGPQSSATRAATRSGATNLPDGWRLARKARSASARDWLVLARSASKRPSMLGVGMVPGQIALQVMLVRAVSSATARVKPMRAVLVVT